MNVPIPVDQLVFREIATASLAVPSVPKVSTAVPVVESAPVGEISVDLGSKVGYGGDSIPWVPIIVGVTVLVVVGVIFYQLEKRSIKREEELYRFQ